MPKIIPALTDAKIRQTAAAAKPVRLFDSKVVGLHVLIQPSGAKLWRLRYTIDKKEKRMAMGSYPAVPLAEARESASELLAQVRKGVDPSIPEVVADTFGMMTNDWFENAKKDKSEQRIAKIEQALNKHVMPAWRNREIKKIKAADIITLLQTTEKSGTYIVKCVHRYIWWIFDYAFSLGKIESVPMSKATLKHVGRHDSNEMRSMEWSRLPTFLGDLDDYGGLRITKLAIKFLMLTGIRTSELRRLKWNWINIEKAIIKIPADQHKSGIKAINQGKKGEDFYVLLSTQAIKILEKAQSITGESEFIFPSPYNHLKIASDAIINDSLKRMGWIDEHSGHGFRALFRSQMEKEGHNEKMLELCLCHSLGRSKTEGSYARGMNNAFFSERLHIMQEWADLIAKQKDA